MRDEYWKEIQNRIEAGKIKTQEKRNLINNKAQERAVVERTLAEQNDVPVTYVTPAEPGGRWSKKVPDRTSTAGRSQGFGNPEDVVIGKRETGKGSYSDR